MCKSVPAVLLNEDRCGLGDGGSLGGGQCQGHTTPASVLPAAWLKTSPPVPVHTVPQASIK